MCINYSPSNLVLIERKSLLMRTWGSARTTSPVFAFSPFSPDRLTSLKTLCWWQLWSNGDECSLVVIASLLIPLSYCLKSIVPLESILQCNKYNNNHLTFVKRSHCWTMAHAMYLWQLWLSVFNCQAKWLWKLWRLISAPSLFCFQNPYNPLCFSQIKTKVILKLKKSAELRA